MHPGMASALASQHRHDMTARAARGAQAAEAVAAEAVQAFMTPAAARTARGARGARGGRRPGRYGLGALLPRYRLSWSRASLPTAAGGGRRGRAWVIVISATRGL